tara:strand:+ start:71 stop:745 length:675 start_codon:yes stop_codon:yes gene_type:complete
MASVIKPHIVTDDLVFCVDKDDPKCNFYGTAKDRAQNITTASNNSTSQNYSTDSVSSFLSDASQITAMVWITKTSTSTGYAEHPLNKWQTSGNALGGAALILYHFGNYNSNGDDGEFGFYTGLGGSWAGTSRTTLVVGDSAFLCYQYTASTGSQFWRDGEKVHESRQNTGLGNLGTDSVGRNFILYTGPASNNSYVSKVMIYDKDVDDDVIIHNYNVTKSRFGH